MKIAVIGTGGVGGYFGALLARHGVDVTFVARGEHFEMLRTKGLHVQSVEGDIQISPCKVVNSVEQLSSPDLVLVTTKTYDRDQACSMLREVISPSTIIIPIQNGIDNDLRAKELLPHSKIYPGLAYIISTRTKPGLVEQTAGPRTLFFGDRDRAGNSKLEATVSEDIELEIWKKFLWIVTFAGMTALCRSPIGNIVNDKEAFEMYVRCLDEGITVARAVGVQISDALREDIIEKSGHYRTTGSSAKSSLLVDIENERRTEIESLNGSLVRLAKEHGIPVPYNEAIYTAVRIASNTYQV